MTENAGVALGLGWTMAELNDHEFVIAGAPPDVPIDQPGAAPHRLPGVSRLTAPQQLGMRLDKIDASLSVLGPVLTGAGQQAPSTERIREQFNAVEANIPAARRANWSF